MNDKSKRPGTVAGRRAAAGAVLAALAFAGACGGNAAEPGAAGVPSASDGTVPGADAPAMPTSTASAVAPGEGSAVTAPAAPPSAEQAPGSPGSPGSPGAQPGPAPVPWSAKSSYNGPHWVEAPSGKEVTVLDETVTISADGSFRALGLVRNDTPSAVVDVRVTASVSDGNGATATYSATVPVSPLRAGEPAPFVITGDKAFGPTAKVAWTVSAAPAAGRSRPDVEVTTGWYQPAGNRPLIDMPSYREKPGEALPFVQFGSIEAKAAVQRPAIVAAWFGADGRVIDVHEVRALQLGTDQPVGELATGGLADFVITRGGPVAGRLLEAKTAMWGVER